MLPVGLSSRVLSGRFLLYVPSSTSMCCHARAADLPLFPISLCRGSLRRRAGNRLHRRPSISSSTGDETYIVDSIRIVHNPGPLFGMTSGRPVGPDAEYQFSFSYGSDRTPALKPVARLSPEDRREVLLTLALSPEGVFRFSTGTVLAWLQYHTMDGRRGSLLLKEPPQEGVLVAVARGSQ